MSRHFEIFWRVLEVIFGANALLSGAGLMIAGGYELATRSAATDARQMLFWGFVLVTVGWILVLGRQVRWDVIPFKVWFGRRPAAPGAQVPESIAELLKGRGSSGE